MFLSLRHSTLGCVHAHVLLIGDCKEVLAGQCLRQTTPCALNEGIQAGVSLLPLSSFLAMKPETPQQREKGAEGRPRTRTETSQRPQVTVT